LPLHAKKLMDTRELIILILGLAIVAVILRGLYLAMRARRGQIRLAIDKNIPRDVDLDALELAELPGGGARVVTRSGAPTDITQAQERAETLDLGEQNEDEKIPILMDTVEIARAEVSDENEENEENEGVGATAAYNTEDDYDSTDHYESGGGDFEEEGPGLDTEEITSGTESPDDVLLDYGESVSIARNAEQNAARSRTDNLSQVAPDYEADEDTENADESAEASAEEYYSAGTHINHAEMGPDEDSQDSEVAYPDEFETEESTVNDLPEADEDNTGREEPELGDPDNEFDDFSMTAGERIGFDAPEKPRVAQSDMFSAVEELSDDDLAHDEQMESVKEESASRKANKRSLFSMFRRSKPVKEAEYETPEEIADSYTEMAPEPLDEDFDNDDYIEPVNQDQDEVPEAIRVPKSSPAREITPQTSDSRAESNAAPEPSEVLVINVMARDGRQFAGHDLLELLIASGLKFGDMQIFHHRLGGQTNGPVVFSVANILNPGTFDLNKMSEFSTIGVSLFLALPSPINNLDAFEQMMKMAEHIKGSMDGEIRDDHRNIMTAQTFEHYRQRIRDFELVRLKALRSRVG